MTQPQILAVKRLRDCAKWTEDDWQREIQRPKDVGLALLLNAAADEICRQATELESQSHVQVAALIEERDALLEQVQQLTDQIGEMQNRQTITFHRGQAR